MENIFSRWREIINADQIGEFIKAAQNQLWGWGDLNFYFVGFCTLVAGAGSTVSITTQVVTQVTSGGTIRNNQKLIASHYFIIGKIYLIKNNSLIVET